MIEINSIYQCYKKIEMEKEELRIFIINAMNWQRNLTSEQYNKMTFHEAFNDKLNELMELCLKNKLFNEDE